MKTVNTFLIILNQIMKITATPLYLIFTILIWIYSWIDWLESKKEDFIERNKI